VGIGIGLALDEEQKLVISNLIPGSLALRSGLLEIGDALSHVDGRDVRGMSTNQILFSQKLYNS
jgi:C-terminal processing protease CtpA/Prc